MNPLKQIGTGLLASLLVITFPLMVAFADYFAFWPMEKAQRRG